MEPLSADDPRMIGDFRLQARLGAGGMGQVYLGFSPAGRPVAIKVIHSQFAADPEFLRRFSHEVTAARAVGGMYTAPVVDSSVTDRSPWLATAYVPGPSLAAVISRYGSLPETAVWRLAAGLAEALRAVHSAGMIHRDLKPANVLLADDGPHVIDFGISRPFHGTQLTSAGMVIGTPGYMSPEQAETGPAGPASDIFSLGCVLAYAATGKAPFEGDNPASVLYRIVSTEPDLGAIPTGLRQVTEACLKKDPAQRPEPAQVIAMINSLGPEAPTTLGSFWPEEVARVIAAEQASQTPDGLTPPASASASSSRSASFSGSSFSGSSSYPGRPPTALATPPPGQGGSTGHAPMLSDGYYAAAAQGMPAATPPGASVPPLSSPQQPLSSPPQSHAGAPPYVMQPGGQSPAGRTPAGQAPAGQASAGQAPAGQMPAGQAAYGQAAYGQTPAGQAAYGQAVFGQPGLGAPAAYSGQAPSYSGQAPSYAGQMPSYPGQGGSHRGHGGSYPGQGGSYQGQGGSYPGQQSGGAGALAQYAPGRRKPMSAEVPGNVHTAIRLMYAGFVLTALDVVLSLVALGRYVHDSNVAKGLGRRAVQSSANGMAGAAVIGLVADILGLACWAWLAVATRRGNGWPRIAGAVLLGIYSICTLFIVFGTKRDPGAQFTTVLVWAIGVATMIPLFSQQAREFFYAWRKR